MWDVFGRKGKFSEHIYCCLLYLYSVLDKAGSAKILETYGFAINSEIKAAKEKQLS